jgi:hypothetical protein
LAEAKIPAISCDHSAPAADDHLPAAFQDQEDLALLMLVRVGDPAWLDHRASEPPTGKLLAPMRIDLLVPDAIRVGELIVSQRADQHSSHLQGWIPRNGL